MSIPYNNWCPFHRCYFSEGRECPGCRGEREGKQIAKEFGRELKKRLTTQDNG